MTFPMHMVGLLKPKGLAFGTDYQDVYDAYITKPDLADAEVDNIMVNGLISDGFWEKTDGIWVLANHIIGVDSLRNWRIPANTATAYNSPAFAQWEGWIGNGSNAYIDLNWNPVVNGVNYTQNSASAGCYIRTNVDESKYDFGITDGVKYLHLVSRQTDNIYSRVNSDGWMTAANTDSKGMFVSSRTASNLQTLYKNKSPIDTDATASTAPPNGNLMVMTYNNNGGPALSYTTKQYSLVFTGSGLTQTDINNITDRFETRMDAHGKGVIAA